MQVPIFMGINSCGDPKNLNWIPVYTGMTERKNFIG
jgi:hypothetical protein